MHGRTRLESPGRLGTASAALTAVAALMALTSPPATADTITGTEGPDDIAGTAGPDTIDALGGADRVRGLGGADRVTGGGGADQLVGGADRDSLIGQGGDDVLDGGPGDDSTLAGGAGDDTVLGGAGGDTLDGDGGADQMLAGPGSDTLFGLKEPDDMDGEAGADELFGGPAADTLRGGPGVDQLEGEEGPDVIEGGPRPDELSFSTSTFQPDATFLAPDVVLDVEGAGATGGDTIQLYGENGYAWLGPIEGTPTLGTPLPGGGDEVVQLGYLHDGVDTWLIADTDDDGAVSRTDFTVRFAGVHDLTTGDFANTSFVIAGTSGDDEITGTNRDDRIFAAGGRDRVRGLSGADEIHGGTGDDVLNGGPGGYDNLFGDQDDDRLTLASSDGGGVANGGPGDDVLFGSNTSFNNFDNSLQGDEGADALHAGAVGSTADGGTGPDTLFSSAGDDNLEAGRLPSSLDLDGAADVFDYTGARRWSADGSANGDLVSGFEDGVDLFDLRDSGLEATDLTIINDDDQTTITSDRGLIVIFEAFGPDVFIDADDFIF